MRTRSIERSVKRLQALASIKGGKFLSTEFKGMRLKYLWECSKDHRWEASANNVQQEHWCPDCVAGAPSKGQLEVEAYVRSITSLAVIRNEDATLFNPKTGRFLEFDIYIPEIRLAIEFDGEYWHSLEGVPERDRHKNELCKNHGIQIVRVKEQEWNNNQEETKTKLALVLNLKKEN